MVAGSHAVDLMRGSEAAAGGTLNAICVACIWLHQLFRRAVTLILVLGAALQAPDYRSHTQ